MTSHPSLKINAVSHLKEAGLNRSFHHQPRVVAKVYSNWSNRGSDKVDQYRHNSNLYFENISPHEYQEIKHEQTHLEVE